MKIHFIIITLLALINLGFSTILIQQNFSSSTFPPPGWSRETSGTGGSWIWTDSGQPGNGYSLGTVSLSEPSQWGSATLITNNFYAEAGQELNIQFLRKNGWRGAEPSDYGWEETIMIGTTTIYSHIFEPSPEYPRWYLTTYVILQLPTTSSEYNVAFKVWGTYESGSCNLFFAMDELLITTGNLSVEPATLGNIKANFH